MPAAWPLHAARALRVVRLAGALIVGGLLPQLVNAQRTILATDSTVGVTVRVQDDTMRMTTVAAAACAAVRSLRGRTTAGKPPSVCCVTATRGERRVEDTPRRVEVIDEEEIAEKVSISPGDIAMMFDETSGLRVQPTNPSLGGANVRIQGLRGRYSLLLADGLPLYGGQAGGLESLQIPPVDLGPEEIIKDTASALYESSALGGVIDLVSRRLGAEADRTAPNN